MDCLLCSIKKCRLLVPGQVTVVYVGWKDSRINLSISMYQVLVFLVLYVVPLLAPDCIWTFYHTEGDLWRYYCCPGSTWSLSVLVWQWLNLRAQYASELGESSTLHCSLHLLKCWQRVSRGKSRGYWHQFQRLDCKGVGLTMSTPWSRSDGMEGVDIESPGRGSNESDL